MPEETCRPDSRGSVAARGGPEGGEGRGGLRFCFVVFLLLVSLGCSATTERGAGSARWAIALHGGAGAIPVDAPLETRDAYRSSLTRALSRGASLLEEGWDGVEVVEAVIRQLEDDPLFNAGHGAVFNAEGRHELDASIMSGADLSCGAVAGVTTVRHPITLARHVMEETRHVLLSGAGAEAFADRCPVERVKNEFFSTERRREQWLRKRASKKGTVGVVVLDREGHLAAGTSTGGLTDKRWGRIGDSPVIGAGTYADDAGCAVSCTGTGEEFIRHSVAASVSSRVRFGRASVQEAADALIHEILSPDDGGLIAVDGRGRIAFSFSTPGMYRAAADSEGRFEVGIHAEMGAVPRLP